jgi:hypothetical protein
MEMETMTMRMLKSRRVVKRRAMIVLGVACMLLPL